jgi:hypothetical protein
MDIKPKLVRRDKDHYLVIENNPSRQYNDCKCSCTKHWCTQTPEINKTGQVGPNTTKILRDSNIPFS